jgi:hypothetical protein
MDEQGINGPDNPNDPGVALDDAVEATVIPGADGTAMALEPENANERQSDDPSGSN